MALPELLRARCSLEIRARLNFFLEKTERKESDFIRDAVVQALDREEPSLQARLRNRTLKIPLAAARKAGELARRQALSAKKRGGGQQ